MENLKTQAVPQTRINQILLVTTKGCEGCGIVTRLIEEAINSRPEKTIEFVSKDVSEFSKKWLKQNKVTDFPTTFLIQNDSIRFSFVGTKPAVVIARWIDVYFS